MYFINRNKKVRNSKGFTLIELIMVIVVLGILAATAIPKFFSLTKDASDATAKGITASLQAAVSGLYAKNIVGNTSGSPYTFQNVIENAQISGLKSTAIAPAGNILTITIGGQAYSWYWTAATLPETPGQVTPAW